jgi:S-adenosylmethionine:tRNA ribosyltransferase-isomerase
MTAPKATNERLTPDHFDYQLPEDRIAQRPKLLDEQLLLVYCRATDSIEHRRILDLPEILRRGDLLVLNNSRVVPAQIRAADGTTILFADLAAADLNGGLSGLAVITSRPMQLGETIAVADGVFTVTAVDTEELAHGRLRLDDPNLGMIAWLDTHGEPPLPPYVRRHPDAKDVADYQTDYATTPGSIAAPTAGLHFRGPLLETLHDAGIQTAQVTLHVGYGTFRRFTAEHIDQHHMEAETYFVDTAAATAIWKAKTEGRRVIPVGTTSTRTIETIADDLLAQHPPRRVLSGRSELFIFPPYDWKIADGLVTNFHYPKTSVMTLTAAMVGGGSERLLGIYQEALACPEYEFFSYGDAMLII